MRVKTIALPLVGLLLALAVAPAGASPVIIRYICFDRDAKLTKPDRRGVVRGTQGSDVIVARRAKVILGRGGNDRICAFGRSVYVAGGAGHDRISTGSGDDTIFGGQGQDLLVGRGGDDRLAAGFGGGDTLVGSGGDDRLEGAEEAVDYLFGGRGEDRLFGGDGAFHSDFLVGGEGIDAVDGGTGRDTVSFAFSDEPVQIDLASGTSSGDVLAGIENVEGSRFDDLLTAGDLGSRLSGDEGDDVLVGGPSNDHIDGGLGQDTMDGGGGLDVLSFVGSPEGAVVDLETGSASASGPATETFSAFEHLVGSAYDDELSGDAGPNEVYGGRGSNALFGRDGDDTLQSGSSGDAGAGEDLCLDSGGSIANCEQELHGDPAAYSTITGPTQAVDIPSAQLKEITGTASAGAFGPEPQNVQIALRRLSGSGCYWWDVGRTVPGHCERPMWVDTDFDAGQGTWSRRIPSPSQLLNPGRYQLRSRIRQPGYTEHGSTYTYNLVEFRLR